MYEVKDLKIKRIGTVKGQHKISGQNCVEFDIPTKHGHDCYNNCGKGCKAKEGFGQYLKDESLKSSKSGKKDIVPTFCEVLADL